MRRDFLEIDTSFRGSPFHQPVEAQDIESLRVLLTGDSVIDWRRMALPDLEAVDRFLATHLIDPSDTHDRERLRYVFNEAVSYLEEHLRLRFPGRAAQSPATFGTCSCGPIAPTASVAPRS